MKNTSMGTLAWAEVTGGRLRRSDRLQMVLDAMGIRLDLMVRRLLGTRPDLAKIDIEQIVIPDTRMAQLAASACVSNSTVSLANHCMRTYIWGSLLACARKLKYDAELLYVSSLLHDLGLTSWYQGAVARAGCFAYEGALASVDLARNDGWSPQRCEKLGDAICLHMNIRVPVSMGVEAHLLNAGAAADVVGSGLHSIPGQTRKRVLAKYPRESIKNELREAFGRQHDNRPHSRIAFLFENGFEDLIARAPFSS